MITKPTVFILGAGASQPYKYPTGVELLNIICENLSQGAGSKFLELEKLKYSPKQISEFAQALQYSGKSSVDAFLEHRVEFMDIGKLAIAQTLIPCENSSLITLRDKWYVYFYDMLNIGFDDFDKNAVSVVTFNYDRSLEYFMFSALKYSYGKSDEECAAKLKQIPIIHVYGQLDYLPWQTDGGGREYRSSYSLEELKKSADCIRIVYEDFKDDPIFNKVHILLRQAKSIIFLGFGYNNVNLNRLRVSDFIASSEIMGSAFGLEAAETESVSNYFSRKIVLSPQCNILQFLRQEVGRDLTSPYLKKDNGPEIYLSRATKNRYSLGEIYNSGNEDIMNLEITIKYKDKSGAQQIKKAKFINENENPLTASHQTGNILKQGESKFIVDFPRVDVLVEIRGKGVKSKNFFQKDINIKNDEEQKL